MQWDWDWTKVPIPYRGRTARNRINQWCQLYAFFPTCDTSVPEWHLMTSARTGIFVWFVHCCFPAPRIVLGTEKVLSESIQLLNKSMNSWTWQTWRKISFSGLHCSDTFFLNYPFSLDIKAQRPAYLSCMPWLTSPHTQRCDVCTIPLCSLRH